MNAAPTIGTLLFDNPSPYSTDTLQVHVVDAVDPDGDPLTFQYDWRVNGQLVQTTTSTVPTATLDLSQPGFGDCGDVIEVFVTASDEVESSSAVASLTVAASPSELYADYLAAVQAANAAFLAATADRDATLAAARTQAQSEADALYAVYEAAVTDAQAVYDGAIAAAELEYTAVLAAADAAWESATASHRATYEAALANAQAAYDVTAAVLEADHAAARAAADTAYETYVAPYQSARDDAYAAWQANPEDEQLQQVYNEAQAALDTAIATATAKRDSDYAAALATYEAGLADAEAALNAAQDAAYADYELVIASANAEWDAAESTAWGTYLVAKEAADWNYLGTEATAWDNYQNGVAGIESDLTITEASIEAQYASVVSAALAAWQAAEATAWNAYTTALATFAGSPEPEARIEAPPAGTPFTALVIQDRQPGAAEATTSLSFFSFSPATAEQYEFADLLIRQMQIYTAMIVQYEESYGSLNFNPDSGVAGAAHPNDPFLQQNQPLSQEELTELEGLVRLGDRANAEQAARRRALLDRMASRGIRFNGNSELEILGRILDAGSRGLRGDPRRIFLDAYRRGLAVAIGGLQRIDEARYQQYQQARRGGAQHDEAWTWQYGGETARRRYELERLVERAR